MWRVVNAHAVKEHATKRKWFYIFCKLENVKKEPTPYSLYWHNNWDISLWKKYRVSKFRPNVALHNFCTVNPAYFDRSYWCNSFSETCEDASLHLREYFHRLSDRYSLKPFGNCRQFVNEQYFFSCYVQLSEGIFVKFLLKDRF